MKSLRRIELYLDENVRTEDGRMEQQMVLHNLSPEQMVEIILEGFKSLSMLLTPDQMSDLQATILKALAELKSSRETALAAHAHLKLHEVL